MALAPLEELAQSYFDLRWHLDPVAATRAQVPHYDDRFGRFAAEALRPHVAALKSLTGALEEIEPEDLDAEIDRTALLNDARVLLYRCERERVFARDPAQWTRRIADGLTLGREPAAILARLTDLPAFLDDARAALVEPVGLFAETALAQLPAAETAARHAADRADAPSDVLSPALAGLAAFRGDLERWAQGGPGHYAAGEDAFNFHLHYEHALRDTAPELWRYGHRLMEELEAAGAAPSQVAESLPDLVVPDEASLVRRLVRTPLTVDGWALWREASPERLLREAVAVLLDVGLHTRGMSVADGIALLATHHALDREAALALVRRTAAAPTYTLCPAVGRRELLRLREAFPSAAALAAAVRPYGALPVSLMRWGLGIGE
jgi:uncharacterized protein (DUF885 family)